MVNSSSKTSTPPASLSSVSSKNESYKVASTNTEPILTQNRDVEDEEEEVAIKNNDEENLIGKLSQISPQTPTESIKALNLDQVKKDGFGNLEK